MVDSLPQRDSGRKLFYGLFVFPLLIAVGMAVLLSTVVLLTREAETPESLITAIKTGSESKRWQKAFELSNELNRKGGLIRSSGVMKEISHILEDATTYDPKTRSYMALALSKFEEPEVVESLRRVLKREAASEVQVSLMWALGVKKAKEARGDVESFLDSEQEEVKKTAVYVLGVIGDESSERKLEPLLNDGAQDVRWNTALALARLGNGAGYKTLVKMTDRRILSADRNLNPEQTEEIIMNAIKGLTLLNRREAMPLLAEIANQDESLKVRQIAIEALKQQKS